MRAVSESNLFLTQIEFGIDALGLAKADVQLDLDASGKLALSLEAGATAATSTNGTSYVSEEFGGCVDLSSTLAVTAGADGSFLGLFDKSTSVTLFSKTFDLFKASDTLISFAYIADESLQKCFGDAPSKSAPAPKYYRRHARDIRRRGLSCPAAALAKPATIADEAISASR